MQPSSFAGGTIQPDNLYRCQHDGMFSLVQKRRMTGNESQSVQQVRIASKIEGTSDQRRENNSKHSTQDRAQII